MTYQCSSPEFGPLTRAGSVGHSLGMPAELGYGGREPSAVVHLGR
jgi:hypothetical protein